MKKCLLCGELLVMKGRPIFCGSWKEKRGCSYKMRLQRQIEYTDKWRRNPKNYQKVKAIWTKANYVRRINL